MGGFRVSMDELRRIKELVGRGVSHSQIAKKLKRTQSFVGKYDRLMAAGKVRVDDEVIIPALLDYPSPTPSRVTRPIETKDFTSRDIIHSDRLTDEQKVLVLKALLT